jgi:UDP-glucose 4-epimerase
MRILITGGFGLVGGRLAQQLQRTGHQIVLGSRHAAAAPAWLPEADVVKCAWNDASALAEICRGVDVVIHAAGMNAQDCEADAVAALEFNGLATARLCAAAVRSGVKRFIYLSTAHVYASPLVGSFTEASCPRNLHPYATSHLAGENAVLHAGQRGKIEAVVLRLSNAFGAPAHKDVNCWMLLVNDLCRQVVVSKSMVLRSAGVQRRDFISLTEVGRAIEHVINLNATKLDGGIVTIGGAWAPRVIEMVELVQARCAVVLGFTPAIIRPEPLENEVTLPLDININKLLNTGFEFGERVETEIDATLAFCSEAFGAQP